MKTVATMIVLTLLASPALAQYRGGGGYNSGGYRSYNSGSTYRVRPTPSPAVPRYRHTVPPVSTTPAPRPSYTAPVVEPMNSWLSWMLIWSIFNNDDTDDRQVKDK